MRPSSGSARRQLDGSALAVELAAWCDDVGAEHEIAPAGSVTAAAAVADFDGNGGTDVAVYRPADQTWYSQGTGGIATQWGAAGDIPLAVPTHLRTLYGL